MNVQDIAIRAFKTAVQTFVALVAVDSIMAGNVTLVKEAVVTAGAAGLSIIWNAIANWAGTE